MKMKQYYLIKNNERIHLSGVILAETYVRQKLCNNLWLLEPLLRISTILEALSLDSEGELKGLVERRHADGKSYMCISDEYSYGPNGKSISYEIVKKLNTDHVYEIRFMAGDEAHPEQCRIILTIHIYVPYLLWTHGFSKQQNDYSYSRSNKVTNNVRDVAHRIFTQINSTSDENYKGKVGEEHEVRFTSSN